MSWAISEGPMGQRHLKQACVPLTRSASLSASQSQSTVKGWFIDCPRDGERAVSPSNSVGRWAGRCPI